METRPGNVTILAFTLLVVMLGYGMIIPLMPFYVEKLGAGGTELGLLASSYALMRLVCGPAWAMLSDRVGRKPVLMVGILGYGITMTLFGLATELWMLFVFRILSGVLSSATSPTTMAYISDSTPADRRSGGMGALGAAMGLGTIVGPGLGGLLGGESLATPFFVAGGLSFLALLLVGWLLPESLSSAARQTAKESRRFSRSDLRLALGGPLGKLLWMSFLAAGVAMAFMSVFGLFALKKFGYGAEAVGAALMVMGLVIAVAQGALAGPLSRRWGERRLIQAGMFTQAAGLVWMALADSYAALLAAVGVFSLAAGLIGPAVSALASRQEQLSPGTTMGLNDAAVSLGRMVGPLAAGLLFDVRAEWPLLAGAAAALLGGVMARVGVKRGEAMVVAPRGE